MSKTSKAMIGVGFLLASIAAAGLGISFFAKAAIAAGIASFGLDLALLIGGVLFLKDA